MFLTENTEPPSVYRRWVAISTIAAVLQRKCWLEWGMEIFYPNLFIVLIGTPATRKGTALRFGRVFLDTLGINLAADETSRQAIIKAMADGQATITTSTGKVIYHSSLTVFSSELTVFLGYENLELLSMLCKMFDCEDTYVYDTVKRGRLEIPFVWLNLLGATTPAQLQASVPQGFIGSGFTSRVIFVFASEKGKIVIKPTLSSEQESTRQKLLTDLGRIHTMLGEFCTTSAFDELYTSWRIDAEAKPPFKHSQLEYYTQRRPTHLFKLSMIYSASRGDSMEITDVDLAKAIDTLDNVERVMPAVFSGIGSNPLAGVQSRMRLMLRTSGQLTFAEIGETFSNDATRLQLGEIMEALEQMGVCLIDRRNKKLIYTGRAQA